MMSGFFGDSGSIIEQTLDKTFVDDKTLEKIEEWRIKMEDALYDFW
jgi:hypothetical protein